MKFDKLLLLFLATIIIFSCNTTEEEKQEIKLNTGTTAITVPNFNTDSAYYFVEKQVELGPRVPNTLAHEQCAKWLTKKLQEYADTVIVQQADVRAFDGNVLKIKNLIASFNPHLKNRILLYAHWDTRPFADQDSKDKDKPILGANDGGSGVGVLLETARQLKIKPASIGIDIIFFDAEDYGQPRNSKFPEQEDTWCLGSQYWAKHPHIKGYSAKYGILLDMVGAKNATFTMEGNSMRSAPSVVNKVWNTAYKLGYGNYFVKQNTNSIIDDHFYIINLIGIPSIDIIQYEQNTFSNFGYYWHTHKDNMEIIDKHTLEAVGQTLLHVIYYEINA